MVVNLYHFDGNNNSMSKTLTLLNNDPISITPTHGITLLGGEIILDYNDTVDWSQVNYLYLSAFAKYYFVKNITLDIGKRVTLNTQVDPLYTFASQIKECPGTCLRAEALGAPTYYPDNRLPVYPTIKDPHSTVFSESVFDVEQDYSYIVGVLSKSP